MTFDFSNEESGWQNTRSRSTQNRFSTRVFTGMNSERALEMTTPHDIADQRLETAGERARRVNGTQPESERELPSGVKSAAIGARGFGDQPAQRASRMFVGSTPPRNVERGDWDTYKGNGDPFRSAMDRATFHKKQFLAADAADAAEQFVYRRPYDGTVPRKGAPARISVVTFDGKLVPLVKSPTGTTKYYSDFTLAGFDAAPTERAQITETFGVNFLKVFGEKPLFVRFSGILVDTPDFNWKAAFLQNWSSVLRATRLVELNARVVITIEDILLEGYFLKLSVSKKSSNNKVAAFQSSFYATSLQLTDSNIVSSQIGTELKLFRQKAKEVAKERRRVSEGQAEAFGSNFKAANDMLGSERDKLTRRSQSSKKPRKGTVDGETTPVSAPEVGQDGDQSPELGQEPSPPPVGVSRQDPEPTVQGDPNTVYLNSPPPPVEYYGRNVDPVYDSLAPSDDRELVYNQHNGVWSYH